MEHSDTSLREPGLVGKIDVPVPPADPPPHAAQASGVTAAEACSGGDASSGTQQTAPARQPTPAALHDDAAPADAPADSMPQLSDATDDTDSDSATSQRPANSGGAGAEQPPPGDLDVRRWPAWLCNRGRLTVQSFAMKGLFLERALSRQGPPDKLKCSVSLAAEARGEVMEVRLDGRRWYNRIKKSAFLAVNQAIAAQLPQPADELPGDTRLALSAGSGGGHVIVQLAADDMPSDSQLKAEVRLSLRRGAAARTGRADRPAAGGAGVLLPAEADVSSSGPANSVSGSLGGSEPARAAGSHGDGLRPAPAAEHAAVHGHLKLDPDARAFITKRQLGVLFSDCDELPTRVDFYAPGGTVPSTGTVHRELEVPKAVRTTLRRLLRDMPGRQLSGAGAHNIVFQRRPQGDSAGRRALSVRPLGSQEAAAAQGEAGPSTPGPRHPAQHQREGARPAAAAQAGAAHRSPKGGSAAAVAASRPRTEKRLAGIGAPATPPPKRRRPAADGAAGGAQHSRSAPTQRPAASGAPPQPAPGQQQAPAGQAQGGADQFQAKLDAIVAHATNAVRHMGRGEQLAVSDQMLHTWRAIDMTAMAIATAATPAQTGAGPSRL